MKDSLFKLYSELIKKESWKYYPIPNLDISIFQDPDLGRRFITNYLGKGEKNDMEIFHFINQIKGERIVHIVSVFFLGYLLYQNCETIKEEVNGLIQTIPTETNEPIEERFKYIWLLISLFHDFGYAVEDGSVEFDKKEFDECLDKLPRRPKGIPAVFSKSLLRHYNMFRRCRFGINDHGIIGGIKLYSDLGKLREEKSGVDKKHYWGKLLENDFRLASWVVACHNVYFIKNNKLESNIPCYRHFQLDKLVYTNQSREIQINKNALFFLFCLVDSIEPMKKVFDLKQLNNITLSCDKESITLGYGKLCTVLYDDYNRTVLSLNDWLTDVSDDGTIIYL